MQGGPSVGISTGGLVMKSSVLLLVNFLWIDSEVCG